MAAINDVIDELEVLIFKDFKGDKKLYQQGINALRQEYRTVVVNTIKKYSESISTYFAIPKHVLLPDDINKQQYTAENVATLEKEILELEQEYLKQKAILNLCQNEITILDSLRPVRDKVDKMIVKIKEVQEKDTARDQRLEALQQSMKEFEKTFDIKPLDYLRFGYIKK